MEVTLTREHVQHTDYRLFNLIETPLEDHNLIEASAGTGKTFTITRLFIRLLLEKQMPVSSILVVTFTEAATHELRERVYCLIKEALAAFKTGETDDPLLKHLLDIIPAATAQSLLNKAVNSFDTCSIYTIHGFCQRVCFDHTFESGSTFGATLITDQSDLINEAVYDFWRINFYNNSLLFIGYCTEQKVSPDSFIELFNKSKNFGQLQVIPDQQPIDFINLEKDFLNLINSLKSEWLKYKNEIVILLNSKTLKATKYKDQVITKMIASMDLFCNSSLIEPKLFKNYENFTSSVIALYTKKNEQVITHALFDLCEEIQKTSEQLCEKYEQHLEYLQKLSLEFISKQITEKKSKLNQLYFDDLLTKVNQSLEKSKDGSKLSEILAQKYRAALIDEFQDTDPVQYSIFSRIFFNSESVTFLIGDPKQAIYGFRGADIFTYLYAAQQVTKKYSLATNYRSQPELVSAVSFLFSISNNPFLFDKIQFRQSDCGVKEHAGIEISGVKQKPLKIWFKTKSDAESSRNESSIEVAVAKEIARMISSPENTIGSQPITPSHFAILVRNNSEAIGFQNALSSFSIPSIIDSNGSVFATIEAQEIYYLLCAIAEPTNSNLINAAFTLPFFDLKSYEIEQCLKDEKSYGYYLDLFDKHHDRWLHNGFDSMISSFFSSIHLHEKILGLPSGERKLTNYLHITELISREFIKNHQRLSSLIGWLSGKIENSTTIISDDEILRLESDEKAVTILTIHKSKGLEFDIVFCPSIAVSGSELRGNAPYVFHQQDTTPALVIGKEQRVEYRNHVEFELLAENLRLFYVAVTRAKYSCYLIYQKTDSALTSALSYLLFGNDVSFPQTVLLKEKLKSLSEEELWRQVKEICNQHQAMSAELIPEANVTITPSVSQDFQQLQCKKIKLYPPAAWKIASYSLLAHSASESKFDEFFYDLSTDIDSSNKNLSKMDIFNFPKGAKAGTFFHSVLEKTDLSLIPEQAQLQKLIIDQLFVNGFENNWCPVIIDIIKALSEVPLTAECDVFSLSQIKSQDCIKEMEFLFPLNDISTNDILHTFSGQMNLFNDGYTGEGLEFSPVGGFMKGFIDMIFMHKNKFYVLDWKSNHLGSDIDNYKTDALKKIMNEEHYHLQYYIYCTALDQYLKKHLKGYQYQKHFGGVFYLFLRGLTVEGKTGIFFNKPEAELVDKLSRVLIRI